MNYVQLGKKKNIVYGMAYPGIQLVFLDTSIFLNSFPSHTVVLKNVSMISSEKL